MRAGVLAIAALLLFTNPHALNGQSRTDGDQVGQKEPIKDTNPRDIMILVDFSNSMSPHQISLIVPLVMGVIRSSPAGSQFVVYPLGEHFLGREPLLRGTIREADSILERPAVKREVIEWRATLTEQVAQLMSYDKTQRTSCYLGSLNSGADYFANRQGLNQLAIKQIFWFGDLIEDCPGSKYAAVNLQRLYSRGIRTKSSFDAVPLGPLAGSIGLISGLSLEGVLIPRSQTESDASVPDDIVRDYWRSIPPKMLLPRTPIGVGTPSESGIQPSSLGAH